MSKTKDHFWCVECDSIETAVPVNGGFCNQCLGKHGIEFLVAKHEIVIKSGHKIRIMDRQLVVRALQGLVKFE